MLVTYGCEHTNPVPILSLIQETKPNGRSILKNQKGDRITIITWYGVSRQKQSGTITISLWAFCNQTQHVILQGIGRFSVFRSLWEPEPGPEPFLPDRHKRFAREYGRDQTNKQRFRDLLIPKTSELMSIDELITQISLAQKFDAYNKIEPIPMKTTDAQVKTDVVTTLT